MTRIRIGGSAPWPPATAHAGLSSQSFKASYAWWRGLVDREPPRSSSGVASGIGARGDLLDHGGVKCAAAVCTARGRLKVAFSASSRSA
jgi:hypothetical protein